MSQRHAYLLAYDVADAGRWRHVHNLARGHGTRLQYSVFRCELDRAEAERLRNALADEIHHTEDRVMLVDMGPLEGFETRRILFMGRLPEDPERGPAIL